MRDVIDVRIRQASSFWPCLIIFAAIWFWKWVLLVVGLIAALVLLAFAVKAIVQDTRARVAAEEQRKHELARRADAENALWHAGDERGIYGLDYKHGQESGR